MRTALAGYLDVINLLSADPLSRLSVQVGAALAGCRRRKTTRLKRTASASNVEMRSDGLSDFSYTYGQLSRFSSRLNHGDVHRSSVPSCRTEGSQPPIPVLSAEACASRRGADDAEKVRTAQG